MKPRYSKFAKITNFNSISCFFSCWFVYLLVYLFVCLFVFFFIFIVRNTSHLEQLKLIQQKRQISIHACIICRICDICKFMNVITRDGQTSVTDTTDNLTTVSLRVVTGLRAKNATQDFVQSPSNQFNR